MPDKPSPQKALADGAQRAQRVLDEQGYLVVASRHDHPIGSILPWIAVGSGMSCLPGPLVVIAESTFAEWRAQRITYHPDHDAPLSIPEFRFYRLLAE